MRTLKETSILTKLLSGFNFDDSRPVAYSSLPGTQPADGATPRVGRLPTANGMNVMPDVTQQELLAAIKQRFDYLESCDFEPWRADPGSSQPGQALDDHQILRTQTARSDRAGE